MEASNGPILYFVEGEVPTNAEFKKAEKFMGTGPLFEFISLATLDFNKPPMEASGVAGKVPEEYKHYPILDKAPKLPVPETVVEKK